MQAVLTAIAKRRPLSAHVSDAVVSSLDIPAVSALLANPDAAIRERTLDAIIDQPSASACGRTRSPYAPTCRAARSGGSPPSSRPS